MNAGAIPRELGPAAIVAIGDELTEGRHPDLNSSEIARALVELGIHVSDMHIVPDDEAAIATLFQELGASHPLVIASGGLGPTLDDVTRHAAARAFGRGLVRDEAALAALERWLTGRGVALGTANERQALIPEGAELLPNRVGSAPGFLVDDGRTVLACLPGPPPELRVLLGEELVPRLEARAAAITWVARARFQLFGLPESRFAEHVGAWMEPDANPRMGVTAKRGSLSVSLRARATTRDAADAVLAARVAEFRDRFRTWIFSETDERLEQVVGRELLEQGKTIATAESCTGGRIAALLTSVAGISASFLEGFVTYSNRSKSELLGVPPELLERHGAVSEEVALAMAEGAARRSGADLAVSATGVAGPGGGTAEKPVGLVWFGLWAHGERSSLERRFPPGDRAWIQELAARTALHLVWTTLAHARRASD